METKISKFTTDEITQILNDSKSFKEVLGKFGYSENGSGSYVTLKNHLKRLDIEIPKYHYYGYGNSTKKTELKTILTENSLYQSRTRLKERLVREKFLEYKCSKCGNEGEWNGEKLALQLEHKNGISNDNRIENLEFLCPNCHSQSKTYGGKNVKIKNNISS